MKTETETMLRIKLENDFLPEHTFDCGQCFRWNRQSDGSYIGVAHKRAVRLTYENGSIVLRGASEKDRPLWEEYFDVARDYSAVKEKIGSSDIMKKAIQFGSGIRILKQDFFETLISFIISQQSSIPKIKRSIELLCSAYGEEIGLSGRRFWAFPSAEALQGVTEEDYCGLGVGYRAKYIEAAVHGVLSGEIDENALRSGDTQAARNTLLKIYGVGNKVADCILLFSLARFDSFPVDVWIRRVIEEDLGGQDGKKLFGEYSGFAQQYLFYWKRSAGN